jgi:geranylgeranyl pyrophosphate synthase
MRYSSVMASRSSEQLEHLAQELAQLTREDRAKVLADAARLGGSRGSGKFIRPKLTGGTVWVGGELRREQLYGDDGR